MEEEKREPEALRVASLMVGDENNEEMTLYILEGIRLNGCSYTPAVDSGEANEDGAYYPLEDVSGADDTEAAYEFVENEGGVGYMLEIFQTILEGEGADINPLDE